MAEIRVPTLGESVTEATIGKWFKKPGEAVAVDEPLVELETDKVTIEVPAPAAGVLADIAAKDGETVADYEDTLQEGAGRGIPMICANPDLEVIRDGRQIVCAGALALRYEELGGTVRWFGKPRAEIYDYCFRELAGIATTCIAAVGDSFRTDLAGAKNAGLDPIFVVDGIHKRELGGAPPDAARLDGLCEQWGVRPVATIPSFVW